MYTIIWECDNGRSWEQCALKEALQLLDNLGAFGVDKLMIFTPDAQTIDVEDLETLGKERGVVID